MIKIWTEIVVKLFEIPKNIVIFHNSGAVIVPCRDEKLRSFPGISLSVHNMYLHLCLTVCAVLCAYVCVTTCFAQFNLIRQRISLLDTHTRRSTATRKRVLVCMLH